MPLVYIIPPIVTPKRYGNEIVMKISCVTEVSSYEYPGSRYYVYVNGSADRYFQTREAAEHYREKLINQAKRNGETK